MRGSVWASKGRRSRPESLVWKRRWEQWKVTPFSGSEGTSPAWLRSQPWSGCIFVLEVRFLVPWMLLSRWSHPRARTRRRRRTATPGSGWRMTSRQKSSTKHPRQTLNWRWRSLFLSLFLKCLWDPVPGCGRYNVPQTQILSLSLFLFCLDLLWASTHFYLRKLSYFSWFRNIYFGDMLWMQGGLDDVNASANHSDLKMDHILEGLWRPL